MIRYPITKGVNLPEPRSLDVSAYRRDAEASQPTSKPSLVKKSEPFGNRTKRWLNISVRETTVACITSTPRCWLINKPIYYLLIKVQRLFVHVKCTAAPLSIRHSNAPRRSDYTRRPLSSFQSPASNASTQPLTEACRIQVLCLHKSVCW